MSGKNFKVGDLVEVAPNKKLLYFYFTIGKAYQIIGFEEYLNIILCDDNGNHNGWYPEYFILHKPKKKKIG